MSKRSGTPVAEPVTKLEFQAQSERTDAQFREQRAYMDAQFQRTDAQFQRVDEQFREQRERSDEQFRYLGAVLEDMRSQNRMTIEAVLGEKQAREKHFAEEVAPRLDALDYTTRLNGEMLKEHRRGLSVVRDDLGKLTEKVDGIDRKLDGKADASLEPRLAALERAAG